MPAEVGVTVGDPGTAGTTPTAPTAPTAPTGSAPAGAPVGSPTPGGTPQDGPSVLGIHVSAPDALPDMATLAFTGGVPTGLIGLGAALLGLGLLGRRLGRERIRSGATPHAAANPGTAG